MPKKLSPPLGSIVPVERIAQKIYLLRSHKVMLDSDLAKLYKVPTKAFNQAVRRNLDRFPEDFMFQLTWEEAKALRSQIVTLNEAPPRSQIVTLKRGQNIKYRPYVFTEHGVAMLSSVLNSQRAVQMNIFIIRAFIKLREVLASHKDLARKIEDLERQQKEHGELLASVYSVVKQLIAPPVNPSKRRIGFVDRDKEKEE